MTFRAALVGCGKIGSEFADDPRLQGVYTHAGAYAACGDTELVAVCDTDRDKAASCARRWGGLASYTDPARMLREISPEIVSICTPDHTHFDLICQAIAMPGVRAVLAEKPLALELGAAREIERRARERNVLIAVNYSRRYSLGHARLRERIRAGHFGEIQAVSGFYTKGTLHNGTHWYDLARFLVGEIESVWAQNVQKEANDDPTLDVFLRFGNGAAGFLHALDARIYSLFEMDVVGTLGRVRIVDSGHWFEIFMAADSPYYSGYRTLVQAGKEEGCLENVTLHAVQDIVECLTTGEQPRCSAADGVVALEVGFAIRASAASGQVVSMGKHE